MLMNSDILRARVRAGITQLDEFKPEWRELINWETLEIWEPQKCLLFQIFGGYFDGLNAMRIYEPGSFYGFDLASYEGTGENFALLTEIWKEMASE